MTTRDLTEMKPFWMVYGFGQRGLTCQHDTEAGALREQSAWQRSDRASRSWCLRRHKQSGHAGSTTSICERRPIQMAGALDIRTRRTTYRFDVRRLRFGEPIPFRSHYVGRKFRRHRYE